MDSSFENSFLRHSKLFYNQSKECYSIRVTTKKHIHCSLVILSYYFIFLEYLVQLTVCEGNLDVACGWTRL